VDIRYQVFVSSTFADLQDERRAVIQTLMEMDCIPAGMELFPAADEEQLAFIKKIIDDCDYYIVIIGGRYGSVSESGLSYTEQEYDYAVSRGLKVIALIHGSTDDIPSGKTDKDPQRAQSLESFKLRLSTGRLVKFWTASSELPGLVSLSLSKTIKTYPAIGWIRANRAASADLINESNTLLRDNEQLRARVVELEGAIEPLSKISLAGLDEIFEVRGSHYSQYVTRELFRELSWAEIFGLISPKLLSHPSDTAVKFHLRDALFPGDLEKKKLNEEDFDTIKVQLLAYDLVSVKYSSAVGGGAGLFWSLTKNGKDFMMQVRTVKAREQG